MASTRSHNQTVKLTKTVVDRAPSPATGQAFLRDAELKGFALRITANGVKSFVVEKRIEGRVKRTTLARYGELTTEQARREAHKLLGKVAMGMNPIAEKEQARLRGTTLAYAFDEFRRVRRDLKPKTLYNYERLMASAFPDWAKRPITELSKDMVAKRHRELGEQRGEAYANLAMRFLRSLLNFAMAHFEDHTGQAVLLENPVLRLTRTRAWFRSDRRQTVIKAYQLPAWYRGVESLRAEPYAVSTTVADFLLLLLFTGLRRDEAAQLTWENVDLRDRSLLIPDPKNRIPHALPLSDFVFALLSHRHASAVNGYVFPGDGPKGYLIEPKRQVAKVLAVSGVQFTLHDLRRTFITIAESLDIQPYAIKRMVNHKLSGDVTGGYIVADVERLRAPVQRVADFLKAALGLAPSAEVISINEERTKR